MARTAAPPPPPVDDIRDEPLARALGAPQVVEGWLEVYDRASQARGEPPDDEGIGTNEYMRSQGGYAVTIECGQHEDPRAISVAERAIHGALALLGLATMWLAVLADMGVSLLVVFNGLRLLKK